MDEMCLTQTSEDSQENEDDDPDVDCIFHADCQGLQSIVLFKGCTAEFQMLDHMCRANSFRGPVWGIIPMKKSVYEALKQMLHAASTPLRKELLKSIKQRKHNIKPTYEKVMEKIPIEGELPFI